MYVKFKYPNGPVNLTLYSLQHHGSPHTPPNYIPPPPIPVTAEGKSELGIGYPGRSTNRSSRTLVVIVVPGGLEALHRIKPRAACHAAPGEGGKNRKFMKQKEPNIIFVG